MYVPCMQLGLLCHLGILHHFFTFLLRTLNNESQNLVDKE